MKKFIFLVLVLFVAGEVFARGGGGFSSGGRSSFSSSRSSFSSGRSSFSSSRSSYSSGRSSSFKSASSFRSAGFKSSSVSKISGMKSSSPSFTRENFSRSTMRTNLGVGTYHPFNNWFLWYFIISNTHVKSGASEDQVAAAYNKSTIEYITKEFREQYPDVSKTAAIKHVNFEDNYIGFECDNKRYKVISKSDDLVFTVTCADVKKEKADELKVIIIVLGCIIGVVAGIMFAMWKFS